MASSDDELRSTATSTDVAPTTSFDDLPNDVIVSIFEKLLAEPELVQDPDERRRRRLNDLRWVRETFPLVCRRWRDLYRSRSASPLHETLEVDFISERPDAVPRLIVRAERVIAWARRHAIDVRALRVLGSSSLSSVPPPRDFTSENLATLVEILGPSLTAIEVRGRASSLTRGPFWDALREHVAPRGQLRKLAVADTVVELAEGVALVDGDVDVSFLGQLTRLEELRVDSRRDPTLHARPVGLRAFPASVLSLTRLRRLCLRRHIRIESLPAGISTLRGLEDLDLWSCGLRSLPEELGALTRLTRLEFGRTEWELPEEEEEDDQEEDVAVFPDALHENDVFPDALRGLKSLRHLVLCDCRLRAVPALIGELRALEHLDLSHNAGLRRGAPWAPFARPSPLTYLDLSLCRLTSVPAAVLSSMPRLRVLKLGWNSVTSLPENLGQRLPELREIDLSFNRFATVAPLRALVGASSLEIIGFDHRYESDSQVEEPLDFLLENFPRLQQMRMTRSCGEWTPASRAHLERFAKRLKERDPTAVVEF